MDELNTRLYISKACVAFRDEFLSYLLNMISLEFFMILPNAQSNITLILCISVCVCVSGVIC